MSSTPASNYVLGQSVHEYERLMLQARMLRPYTEKFFRAAGLAPGMRVLDVGSGMGDVALLSADIVGPGGRVLGIDRDADALDNARRRTDEQGYSSWVEFQASNLDEFTTTDQFDALVGRYVLLYQPDPSSIIRSLLRSVKPGGIVFHEFTYPARTPATLPAPSTIRRVDAQTLARIESGAAPEWPLGVIGRRRDTDWRCPFYPSTGDMLRQPQCPQSAIS
jgi:ubiquinone/menaquinone biosynthesis C-methylase UbiE